jgi:predicted nucleic acid-binding protein
MALAWVFERQQTSEAERAARLLDACGDMHWWVPGLWHLEVTNALLVAERRSVLPPADSDLFLARLNNLPFHTDTGPPPDRGASLMALARTHGLSSYDASYLELAQRLDASLASFDRQLNRAAAMAGVALFPEP